MTDAHNHDALRQVVQRIEPGGTFRRAWPVTGGVSAQITAIEYERPGGEIVTVILRRHGEVDRARKPHIARDEFALLQIAQSHGLAAPKPFLVDESCDLFPTPYLVVEFVAGDTVFAPPDVTDYLTQTAAQLAKIHGVPDSPELAFLPRLGRGFGNRPAALDASMDEGRIRDALAAAWPLPRINAPALLHGDYWPGNLLWRDGALAAVIDWEDAAVGDPLADLGNTRLELLWSLGPAALTSATNHYQSQTSIDLTNLPYWDLSAALRPCGKLATWGLDAETERRMRDLHRRFVTEAIDALAQPAEKPTHS